MRRVKVYAVASMLCFLIASWVWFGLNIASHDDMPPVYSTEKNYAQFAVTFFGAGLLFAVLSFWRYCQVKD